MSLYYETVDCFLYVDVDLDADKFTSKTQKMGQTDLAVTWFEESELGSRTVELSGLKMLHTQDILQDYFNDKKLNTESIDVDTASNTATVIFSLIKGRLINYVKPQSAKLYNLSLTLEVVHTQLQVGIITCICTI